MTNTVTITDINGNVQSLTVDNLALIKVEGLEPEQETMLKLEDVNNVEYSYDHIGGRPKDRK